MFKDKLSVRSVILRLICFVLLIPPMHFGVAVAAEPKSFETEFTVDEYTDQGSVMGCSLSVLTSWGESDGSVYGASTNISSFAPYKSNIFSSIKTRMLVNGKWQELSYAWIGLQGENSTKSFSQLTPTLPGPWLHLVGKPDLHGIDRLMLAAKQGFILGHSIAGLPLDAVVQVPPVPPSTYLKLSKCLTAVDARLRSFNVR